MHSHNAIELLKTLNEEEMKLLGDFIRSPFFNKREVLIRLYELVAKYYPDFSSPALKKENLYKKLFPGKEYNEQTLRSRISDLSNLIKMFIIENRFRKEEFAQKKYFIDELISREKFELSERYINESIQEIDDSPERGQEYFFRKFELITQQALLWTTKDQKTNTLYSSLERSELFLNYTFLEFLKINNDVICYEIESGTKQDFSFAQLFLDNFNFEGYIKTLKEKNYKYYPLLSGYYFGNMTMLKPEDDVYFFELKDLIYKHHAMFEVNELSNFWILLSNGVYTNYLKKGMRFMEEGNEINKFFINNKLYDESEPFSVLGFQNIFMNAFKVKDLDWGEEFIEAFKDKLPSEVIQNRYHFCKALICFERKDYNAALSNLNYVKYTEWDLKLDTRFNYLKNYYELGLSDQVISLLDSIRHYLTKNKDTFPEAVSARFKQTMIHISKMSNAKFSGKKLDYADFKNAENAVDILHKPWIIEKMKELI